MKLHIELSSLDKAKYQTVRGYKGGAAKLAPMIGIKNSKTLSNKVNPNLELHQLTVDESIYLQRITKNYEMLHATALLLDHVCLPIPVTELKKISDIELLDSWGKWHAQIGVTVETMREALDDNIIDEDEVNDIERDMHHAIACGMALVERFKVMSQRPRK